MDIEIKIPNAARLIFEQTSAGMEFSTRKTWIFLAFVFVMGAFCLVFGLSSGGSTVYIDGKTTIYELHIFSSAGVSFISLGLIYLYYTFVAKRKHMESITNYAYKRGNSNEVVLRLTDEGVYHQDLELKQEMKWSLFTKASIYKHYIVLTMDESHYFPPVMIDKRFMSLENAEELIRFLTARFQLKT
jgi:hypothetical protein